MGAAGAGRRGRDELLNLFLELRLTGPITLRRGQHAIQGQLILRIGVIHQGPEDGSNAKRCCQSHLAGQQSFEDAPGFGVLFAPSARMIPPVRLT